MAKGKSKRRTKHWKHHYQAGREDELAARSRERLGGRQVKLGEGSFGGPSADDLDGADHVEGMVTGVFQRGTFVRVPGQTEGDLFCGIAKTYRPPEGFEDRSPLAVGDDVTIALTPAEYQAGQTKLDRNRMDGMILARQPRRTALSRPQPRSAKRNGEFDETYEKVIAANMDKLLIVVATRQPPTRPGLIDRFLIVAERGELTPVVLFNKIDLAEPNEQVLGDLQDREIPTIAVSAATGAGLDALREQLRDCRTVLAGASGVGKSTLINALIPQADAATRTVREKDQRGRHTTSQARIYDVPGGGLVVDTPGVRELAIKIDPAELPWYFPEFEPYVPQCKFNNCTHTHEPDCAVRRAVEAEEIPRHRFESYLRILDSMG